MKIVGIAGCVPKNVVESTVAYEHFPKHDVDRIIGNTAVERKREALPNHKVSDFAVGAGEDLLEAIGWEKDSVDALILVTSFADVIMPATSHRIQHRLGLRDNCLVFDMRLGCSGYTHGLLVAESLLKMGLVKRVLLCASELSAGLYRPRIGECRHRSDLANSILFGDAGTVTALTSEGEGQVVARQFGADGGGFDKIIVPGGGGEMWWSPELFERKMCDDEVERRPLDLILKGPDVLTFTMKRIPRLMKDLIEQSGWSRDDIDALVPHQANKFMLDFLARRMKLPNEKMLLSIQDFGNTSATSIPLTMVVSGGEHLEKPTKWALLGFGVGLSWSGLLLETDKIIVPPLREI
ncbi:MAG: 3-oxoacyl-ACP synthase III family protein [Nannocystaceae bacterium]|nr:ketoacyl-ACP synthase III [bacterium]